MKDWAADAHRTPLRIVTLIAAVALGFALCEAALRVAGPRWLRSRVQEISSGSPVLGEMSRLFDFVDFENGRFARFHPHAIFLVVNEEYRTDVHVTDWGTRVTGMDMRGPDAVAFVGDSFTFGIGVNDRETFVSVICRRQGIACVDAAFPGSTLSTQLDVVEHHFAEWGRPRRLVFVFFAGNDLPELVADQERSRVAPGSGPRAMKTRLMQAVSNRVNNSSVLRRSYVVQLAKAVSRSALMPAAMDPMFFTASRAHGEFGTRAASALDAALDRLEGLSARLAFTATFIMMPDRFQLYPTAMEDKARYYGLDPAKLEMRFPQRILAAQLDRRRITYVDLLGCLDPLDETLYYQHDNHLTAHGHAAVAGCLAMSAADSRTPGVF